MSYFVKITTQFKKSYKLAIKRGLDISLLEDVVKKLKNNIPLEEHFHDHQLTGNMKLFRECHIQPNWLLVYLKQESILTLTLVDTGTHSDLFGK
ncbi:type II toxin-antitoxin system YafQ family toxin [Treponema parvum]|uniref:Type II toxin-antitoxin system YafQ family toxin n=2 Tax=Treponema parvum TaxID=138851 RepID=A0A975F2T9_9SPIR|nr:type II toxin-antitoxin system YafQ family toxin [Treponema parvum]QTQ13059.1 type II toxin-antitoxin system YafQ family toxin [Treponema parvum]